MPDIAKERIAILATHGYERSELREPLDKLRAEGARVDVVSLKSGEIRSWDDKNWGDSVPVDRTLDEVSPEDYWFFRAGRSIPICCAPRARPSTSSGASSRAGSPWRRSATDPGCSSKRMPCAAGT